MATPSFKRPSTIAIARQTRQYSRGDRVKVLRGRHAGKTMEIEQSANDWVILKGMLTRDVMSKGNIEPEIGFTDDEMTAARRIADRIRVQGSLV